MLVRHPSHPSSCYFSLPDIRVWPTRLQCTRCEQVTYAGSCYRPYRAAGASACSPCAAGSYYGSTGARHLTRLQKYRLYHVTLTSQSSAWCACIYDIFHIYQYIPYITFSTALHIHIIMLLVIIWAHFSLARNSLLEVI